MSNSNKNNVKENQSPHKVIKRIRFQFRLPSDEVVKAGEEEGAAGAFTGAMESKNKLSWNPSRRNHPTPAKKKKTKSSTTTKKIREALKVIRGSNTVDVVDDQYRERNDSSSIPDSYEYNDNDDLLMKKRKIESIQHEMESPTLSNDFQENLLCRRASQEDSPDGMTTESFSNLFYPEHDERRKEEQDQEEEDNNDDHDEDDDDDNEDDESSCDSTVVMEDRPSNRTGKPPLNATQEELAQFYWRWCYGETSPPIMTSPLEASSSFSTSSVLPQPLKSCLSAKKTKWSAKADSTSTTASTPRMMNDGYGTPLYDQETPSTMQRIDFDSDRIPSKQPTPNNFQTTPNMMTPQTNHSNNVSVSTQRKRMVQFGSASAVEFKSSRPTIELTPMTKDQAMKEFPLDKEAKSMESDDEEQEEEELQETARNGAILAAWEDVFDTYANDDFDDNDSIMLADSDDDDNHDYYDNTPQYKPIRTVVTHSRSSDRRKSSGSRRSSTFFQRSSMGLMSENDDKDDKVTEKESDDDLLLCGMENLYSSNKHVDSPFRRDSLQFSSPSECCDSWRLSTSDSDGSRVTPTSFVRSSSSVLRSMHSSGGAHMDHSSDDLSRKNLKPNQLDLKLQFAEALGTNDPEQEDDSFILEDKLDSYIDSKHLYSILKKATVDVVAQHNLMTSTAVHDVSMMVDDKRISLLGMKRDIDEVIQSQSSSFLCQENYVEILGKAIEILEDQNLMESHSTNDLNGHLSILRSFSCEDREKLYENCAMSAITEWLMCEEEALRSSLTWLGESMLQMYAADNDSLSNLLNNTVSVPSIESIVERTNNSLKYHGVDTENIEMLSDCIISEENSLLELQRQLEYLDAWNELEDARHFLDESTFRTLRALLPYFCHFDEDVRVSYPHFDHESSQTIVRWKPLNVRLRESMDSSDFEDEQSLSLSKSSIQLIKKQSGDSSLKLPSESVAQAFYSTILQSDHLHQFLSEQFEYEDEMAILTTSDVFRSLDFVALDILSMESLEDCHMEMVFSGSVVDLVLTISSSAEYQLITIKFGYSLANDKCVLNFLPCNVQVMDVRPAEFMTEVSANISNHILTATTNVHLFQKVYQSYRDTVALK